MVPCCSEDDPLLPRGKSPAAQRTVTRMISSQTIIKCDNAAAVRCSGALYTDCSRDIKDGDYEEHECAPTLTPEEEKQAAGLLKRAISTS